MPLYEYRCASCEAVIEALQKFSDPPLSVCTKCGGSLERLISPPGLQFKGTGWYITDYARAGGTNGGKSEKLEPKTESKTEKSESKSEKPAATTAKSEKK
ncbi:MAG: zinc ribbon domain-containing protein [Bryobacteraceae bacterium]|nr:zinc ribbon domain-containing protein [Bryobacteraceae bacterium]